MDNSLRMKWDDAGYGMKMGSACVVAPPPQSVIRVYHLTKPEFAISSIGLARLKVARFSDLNDPFELISLTFKEQSSRTAVKDFKHRYNEHSGLLCFSANWTDPVLWSHYGDRHRGICLGFDLDRELAEHVRYEDERLRAELDHNNNPLKLDTKLQRLLLCTKFHHWKYEREIRGVKLAESVAEGSLHFWPFQRHLQLAEVILGPECDLPLGGIRELVKARFPKVVVFKARLALKTFDVVPLEATVP